MLGFYQWDYQCPTKTLFDNCDNDIWDVSPGSRNRTHSRPKICLNSAIVPINRATKAFLSIFKKPNMQERGPRNALAIWVESDLRLPRNNDIATQTLA